ncbi:MAG: hypothetical protein F7B59_03740 [Desulfurococcales archaeon]|nr:hypothetical protein [Desulfurococcales archaeon]
MLRPSYRNAMFAIIAIITASVICYSNLPFSLYETYAISQSDNCLIKSSSSHLEYIVPPNETVKFDNLIRGVYRVQGTSIELNLSQHYFFECSPDEYMIASTNPHCLDRVVIRKIQGASLIIEIKANYTLNRIDIGGLSFHGSDVSRLNNSLVIQNQDSITIPYKNSTLALSLLKNGAHLKISINNSVIDLVIYPPVENKEDTIPVIYTRNNTRGISESPTRWSGVSSFNSNIIPVKRGSDRRIFYTITLIVSIIILLYYVKTVRKLD